MSDFDDQRAQMKREHAVYVMLPVSLVLRAVVRVWRFVRRRS